MSARWSLGTLIGLPLAVLVILGFIALGAWFFRSANRPRDSYSLTSDREQRVFGLIALGIAFLIALGTAVGMYPYRAEYHQWRPINGDVTNVSSRLLGDGSGGMNQRFVVTFDNGATRSCDDTRCSLVKPGDHLWLSCKRHWQFAGSDGFDCNYVRWTRGNA